MRPNWYGNCVATYGFKSVLFENLTCKAPTLLHPLPNHHPDTTMFIFYTSFGGNCKFNFILCFLVSGNAQKVTDVCTDPPGNAITLKGWSFENMSGNSYTARNGIIWDGHLVSRKMVWTKADVDKGGIVAPYYFPTKKQQVNVYVDK